MEYNQADLEALSPYYWVRRNNLINERGKPMEFKEHKFLRDLYMSWDQKVVICKSSQIGFSTLALLRTIHWCKYRKMNVIYILPSRNLSAEFLVPKLGPILENNPVLANYTGETNNANLKRIGDNYAYWRGAFRETEAIAISADVLFMDEYDRADQNILRIYRSRLDAADPEVRTEWAFSNPSVAGYGVGEFWDQSDQRHWFVKCKQGHKTPMIYPQSLDAERQIYQCTECRTELTLVEIQEGEWVKKFFNRSWVGYWMSQLLNKPATEIIEKRRIQTPQVFYNFTLGLPYASPEMSVNRKSITDCLVPGYNPRTNVAMGVDNGVIKTVVIGNSYGIFQIYETDDWEEIASDIRRYNAYCVIDALPYPRMPRELTKRFKGKVFNHYFLHDQKDLGVIKWPVKGSDKQYIVESDRTQMMDQLVNEINSKQIIFNLTVTDLEQYIVEWGQIYRTVEETPRQIPRPTWKKIEGRKVDYPFATLYWRIALEKTIIESGVVRSPYPEQPSSPVVSPDQTIPAIDLEEIKRRANRPDKSWLTR